MKDESKAEVLQETSELLRKAIAYVMGNGEKDVLDSVCRAVELILKIADSPSQ